MSAADGGALEKSQEGKVHDRKEASRLASARYRAANREKHNARNRAWNRRNVVRRRNRARKAKQENPVAYAKMQATWRRTLLRSYGLTEADYDELLRGQNGVCAICGSAPRSKRSGGTPRLCVDHDHITGKVRGLLCDLCNSGIGKLKDSTHILARAILYLEKHQPR